MSPAKSQTKQKQDKFTLRAKHALVDHGLSVTTLAASLGLARNTVSLVINHPTLMPGVKARISEFLKL